MKPLIIIISSMLFILPVMGQNEAKNNNETYGVTFSFPWMSYYEYINYEKNFNTNKLGFFGVGIAGYYKKNKNKISLNIGITEDQSSPTGRINYSQKGTRSDIGSAYSELIYQRPVYKRIGIIAGFNYTNYIFQYISYEKNISSYKKIETTLGTTIGVEYRFDDIISVATIYRAAVASFEADNYYQSLLSVDLRIDLDIRKKTKEKLFK